VKVTEVRVRTVEGQGKLRGFASVTFDDEFVVHDIRIVEGQNGLFVAMPGRKMPDGTFRDVCHPITSEMRETLTEAVLGEYGGKG